jgi:predicted transcriptional regulator
MIMTTITLEYDDSSPEAVSLIKYIRTLSFIREKKAVERTPPCQYATAEEFYAAVAEGMEAYQRGEVISQEELEEEMKSWR